MGRKIAFDEVPSSMYYVKRHFNAKNNFHKLYHEYMGDCTHSDKEQSMQHGICSVVLGDRPSNSSERKASYFDRLNSRSDGGGDGTGVLPEPNVIW
jgi:hypothetical protein